MQAFDPIDLARRAGYLDHSAGLTADECPPFRSGPLRSAWLEGWRQRRADVERRQADAVRSSGEERGTVDPETLGSIPAALPA